MALLLTEKPGRARPVPSGASRIAPVAERGSRERVRKGARRLCRLPSAYRLTAGQCGSSDRGERGRAAGIGLTIQIAANHSYAIARSCDPRGRSAIARRRPGAGTKAIALAAPPDRLDRRLGAGVQSVPATARLHGSGSRGSGVHVVVQRRTRATKASSHVRCGLRQIDA